MKEQISLKRRLPLAALLALLTGLILCPLITVFTKAVITDGRLNLYQAWSNIADSENLHTVFNSLLLGICVVLCSTVIAAPTAFLLARTELAKHSWLDIVFMIPFMTPPYIASMGWILFMQKRGLFQQLFPFTGKWSEGFFCFGGLVLVMSLHVFPFLMTMLKNRKNGCSAITERFRAIAGREYMNNPTLSGIAAEMNLSREHLTRVYSAETGNTPGRYLDKLRFETLCDLLSTGLSEDKIVAMMHFYVKRRSLNFLINFNHIFIK